MAIRTMGYDKFTTTLDRLAILFVRSSALMWTNVNIPTLVDLERPAPMSSEGRSVRVHQDLKEILTRPDATTPTSVRDHHRFAEETPCVPTSREDSAARVRRAS